MGEDDMGSQLYTFIVGADFNLRIARVREAQVRYGERGRPAGMLAFSVRLYRGLAC